MTKALSHAIVNKKTLIESLNYSYYNKYPTLSEKIVMGSMSGALAGVVGNPADMVMTRMSADGQLPEAKRYNYSNAFNAIWR